MDRRGFLKSSALAVGGLAAEPLRRRPVWAQGAPAVVTPGVQLLATPAMLAYPALAPASRVW